MKKIMFGILVALAVVANAGQVKWTALNVYGADGATKNTAGIGYMFSASDMSAVTAALAMDNASAAAAAISDLAVSSATTTTGSFSGPAVDYASGSQSFFAVIFDQSSIEASENYFMTTTKTGTVPDSGAATIAFGNQSSATFGKNAYTAAGWAGGSDVPEPTSGLLLLVGGAMLALRRKQK